MPHTGHTDTTKLQIQKSNWANSQYYIPNHAMQEKVVAHRMPPVTQANVAVAVGMGAMECQLVWFSPGWRCIAYTMVMIAMPISSKLATSIILWRCTLHGVTAAVVMCIGILNYYGLTQALVNYFWLLQELMRHRRRRRNVQLPCTPGWHQNTNL